MTRAAAPRAVWRPVLGGIGLLWLGLIAAAAWAGLTTLIGLAVFGAIALALGALAAIGGLSARAAHRADGAAVGAMLAAALVFVVPHALVVHHARGGIGLALGLVVGLCLHWQHARAPARAALFGLTLHTLSAGIALGLLYALQPTLGWTVGLAILAHKGPAGYLLTRRLQKAGRSPALVTAPALATGLGALPIAMMQADLPISGGLLFGVAAGLFVAVAVGFVRDDSAGRLRDPGWWAAGILGGTGIALLGAWL